LSELERRLPEKTSIAKQVASLIEARSLAVQNGRPQARPSLYWSEFIDRFAYMSEISESSLDKIRQHTYHLTGDKYLMYMFCPEGSEINAYQSFISLSDSIGSRDLAEPADGIGHVTPAGLVSADLMRYLSVLKDLVVSGAVDNQTEMNIVELGGGYGGLGRIISKFNQNANFSIIDLEETLLFSKSYLSRTLPDHSVEIVHRASDIKFGPQRINLIPQHILEDIDLNFDLMINHQSMQEMQFIQVERYLSFISRSCDAFYSRNLKKHPLKISAQKGLSFDVGSQILNMFGSIKWKWPQTNPEVVSEDDYLVRLLVDCKQSRVANVRRPHQSIIQSDPSKFHLTGKVIPLAEGGVAYEVPVIVTGSTVSLNIAENTGVGMITLQLCTWDTIIERVDFDFICFDRSKNECWRSRLVCLDVRNWEEMALDLRSVPDRDAISSIELRVVELKADAKLGVYLFLPNQELGGIFKIAVDGVTSQLYGPGGRVFLVN
jgi:hypothetical protein